MGVTQIGTVASVRVREISSDGVESGREKKVLQVERLLRLHRKATAGALANQNKLFRPHCVSHMQSGKTGALSRETERVEAGVCSLAHVFCDLHP